MLCMVAFTTANIYNLNENTLTSDLILAFFNTIEIDVDVY